jgi:hypothetical protein
MLRPQIIVLIAESLLASYIAVVILSVHICDRTIDVHAESPWSLLNLVFFDVLAAAIYGAALAVGSVLFAFVVRRFGESLGGLTSRIVYGFPIAICLATLVLIVWLVPVEPGQCRPL